MKILNFGVPPQLESSNSGRVEWWFNRIQDKLGMIVFALLSPTFRYSIIPDQWHRILPLKDK